MARVRLLARQSLTRADSVSVAAQIETMTTAFAALGHTIIDPPLTAQNTRGWREIADRTDLTEALTSADRREYDALGVYSIDRLARNVRILETVVHELERHGVSLLSYAEPFIADAFMRQIMGAVAERFSSDLSRRMKSIWPRLHQDGKHHGVAPYGFMSTMGKLESLDHSESVIMRRICDAFLAGQGIRDIVLALDAAGIAPRRAERWTEDIVRVMLRNPALAGGVRLNGAVVWDAHPGLIARADWDLIQSRLGQPTQPRAHKLAASWLDGLVEHGCGTRAYVLLYRPRGEEIRMIACRTSHLPSDRRCDVLPRSASARKVEAAARLALATDLAARMPVDTAIARAQRQAGGDLTQRRRDRIDAETTRWQDRRQRAEGLYLDGRRDRAWWEAEEAECGAALSSLSAEREALPVVPAPARYETLAAHLATAATRIARAADEDARAVLLAAGVVVLDGLSVRIRYHPGPSTFVDAPCRVPWR